MQIFHTLVQMFTKSLLQNDGISMNISTKVLFQSCFDYHKLKIDELNVE